MLKVNNNGNIRVKLQELQKKEQIKVRPNYFSLKWHQQDR